MKQNKTQKTEHALKKSIKKRSSRHCQHKPLFYSSIVYTEISASYTRFKMETNDLILFLFAEMFYYEKVIPYPNHDEIFSGSRLSPANEFDITETGAVNTWVERSTCKVLLSTLMFHPAPSYLPTDRGSLVREHATSGSTPRLVAGATTMLVTISLTYQTRFRQWVKSVPAMRMLGYGWIIHKRHQYLTCHCHTHHSTSSQRPFCIRIRLTQPRVSQARQARSTDSPSYFPDCWTGYDTSKYG